MNISKEKFKELAKEHLIALESYKIDKNGNKPINIFGIEKLYEAMSVKSSCKSDIEQLNVYFNVGDKVLFDNKKAVVLWTSVNYLDIELVDTNRILQGVHTFKVLPR